MSLLASSTEVLFVVTIISWTFLLLPYISFCCFHNIGPVRVHHKVSTTGDGARKHGDVEISNFPIPLCDGVVIHVFFV